MYFHGKEIIGDFNLEDDDIFVIDSYGKEELRAEDKNRLAKTAMDYLRMYSRGFSCEMKAESFWNSQEIISMSYFLCLADMEFSLYKGNKYHGRGHASFSGDWTRKDRRIVCSIDSVTIGIEQTDLVKECFKYPV